MPRGPDSKLEWSSGGHDYAKIVRRADSLAVACDGVASSSIDEKKRDPCHPLRGKRKKGFLNSPVCDLLFLSGVCRCISFSRQELFQSEVISSLGVILCAAGLLLLLLSLVSLGESFRVGIDADRPDKLVTTGIFAFSRNPIYVAFGLSCWDNSSLFPIGFF